MMRVMNTQFTRTPGNSFMAPNAVVVGDVHVGELCSFWFGAVVRGDVAPIRLGRGVNIQDNSVIHCDSGIENVIEDNVTIGHGAIIHGMFVGEGSLVGMGATILGKTKVGKRCLVAAGAVLSPGMEVPDGMVAMGVPAKIIRPVRDAEFAYMRWLTEHYISLAKSYINKSSV
jgi:carbonic anhydrase/acetyltransferase-like protein (isoleucine patch superfamily)